MEPEVALGNLTFVGREGLGPTGNMSNLTVDQLLAMLNPENYPRSYVNERLTRTSVIIAFYSTIVLVSLFGNLFVCYVITKRRRMRTRTNFLMTNMAVSDLVMTCLNIPFNIARILLNTWPFGSALCIFVPFVQVTSVRCFALSAANVTVTGQLPIKVSKGGEHDTPNADRHSTWVLPNG